MTLNVKFESLPCLPNWSWSLGKL